jgi:hypothetical protein
MKNHWLKNKNKITVEDIHLARELEAEGVESVCEYKELANVELEPSIEVKISDTLAPFDYGEVTIGAGAMPIKTDDITWNSPPTDLAISSITIGCDWASFEPGQTALAELDMDISDGSIKYIRETTIGPFTFKDAGELGVDIFMGTNKLGWLNGKGEESLEKWLNQKRLHNKSIDSIRITSNIRINSNIKVISNECVKEPYDVYCREASYMLAHANIIRGSFLFTAYINDIRIQSEGLGLNSKLTDDVCNRPAIKSLDLDYSTGKIIVNWVNYNPEDKYHLSVCYEYQE